MDKSPIKYYGGKQTLAPRIVGMIRRVRGIQRYVEPFCGGAAVFFALPRIDGMLRILNDKNAMIANFYIQVKSNHAALAKFCEERLIYSEALHERAKLIWKQEVECDEVERAWAVWYSSISCFSSVFGGGFSYCTNPSQDKGPNRAKVYYERLLASAHLLEKAVVHQRDAVDVCKLYDSESTIFYLDPPYVSARQGHYSGYTQEEFERLLKFLVNTKAKFILSHYENEAMNGFIKDNGWCVQKIDTKDMASPSSKRAARTEWLISNFSPHDSVLR